MQLMNTNTINATNGKKNGGDDNTTEGGRVWEIIQQKEGECGR